MPTSTPTASGLAQRLGDFATLPEALDYAAGGQSGLNFHAGRGELTAALPYAELRSQALALARRLLGAGLEPGDRVALLAATDPDFVVAFLACQYAGLIPAPLPLPLAFGGRETYVDHVTRLAREARASALFAPPPLLPWLAPQAATLGLKIFGSVAELAAKAEPATGPLPAADPEGIAYLQFSSGSTRSPAGVAVRQHALMSNAAAILQHGLQVRPDDRSVSWLPLYHDMGMVGFLLAPLAGQVTVDLLPTQDFARRPRLWLSLLSDNRGTISYSPSFGYELCVRRRPAIAAAAAEGPALDLSAWRVAGIGGDMIRPGVLAGFAEAYAEAGFRAGAFLPSYGMAEATLAISFARLGAGIETDTVSLDRLEREGVAEPAPANAAGRIRSFVLCGAPLPGHELEIRGEDARPLPERHVGRIHVRGPSLMQGYDGRPEETAEVLSADGWLDTGDLGYSIGGSVVITGRAKDLIIVNGRNIWPQDLEWSVEQSVPGLRTGDVAAFSVEGEAGETVVLMVEARASDPAGREQLKTEVASTLRMRHGIECQVVLTPPGTLPTTSSGKLSRARARRLYLERPPEMASAAE
jgi:fatty-acyl-CoA synthase